MSRFKTFDATGIAPGGRIFAGDLNAIQDRYADLTGNFSQTVDVGTLRVGDSSIQLNKFGTAEARITAALRVDNVLRGLGGIVSGTFTTTQRDAIPSGQRPFGLIILNTTTGEYEWNMGTDGSPDWQPLHPNPYLPGFARPWFGALSSLVGIQEPESGWLLCNGASLEKAGIYADLFTHLGVAYGEPDGSHFNLPNTVGRVMLGSDGAGHDRGEVGGEFTHVLTTAELAAHTHAVSDPGHAHGVTDPGHSHLRPFDSVVLGDGPNAAEVRKRDTSGNTHNDATSGSVTSISIQAAATGLTNQNAGSGTAHENMPPFVVIGGWVIKY